MISVNKSNAAPPKVAKLALFAGLVSLLAPLAASAEPSARPNIVIMYADDMGYGDLGVQNPDSKIPTPHLDRLAREGMRFTDAHSSAALCSPSRYALLTGSYHWRRLQDIVQPFGPPAFQADRSHAAANAQSGQATAPPASASGTWAGIGKRSRIPTRSRIRRPAMPPTPSIGRSRFPAGRPPVGSTITSATTCRIFRPTPGWKTTASSSAANRAGGAQGHTRRGRAGTPGRARCPRAGIFTPSSRKLTQKTVDWIGEQRDKDGPILSLCAAQFAAHADRAGGRISRPIAGRRIWRLGRPDRRQRRPDSASAGRQRLGREHAGDLFVRQRAGSACLPPRPQIRSPQRRPAARRETRSVGGGASRAVDRSLAGTREAGGGQRRAGQPGRRDGHAGRRGRRDVAGRLGSRQLQSAADVERGGRQPATQIVHNAVAGGYAVRHDKWLLVDAKTGGVVQAAANGSTRESATRRTSIPASCTI